MADVTFTGEVHPVADLFPMLADDELHDLADDIKARGLLAPLTLDTEGRLLDGRNRLAACKIAGVSPDFDIYEGDDPAGYALTVNITRRHLSTGARAIIAAQAARLNGIGSRKGAAASGPDLDHRRVAEAFLVLDWAPARVPGILADTDRLSLAVEEAREAKARAEAIAAHKARLQAEAPDLWTLVDEHDMPLDDAMSALAGRVTKAEQDAAEAKRKAAEERRDSLALLDRILDLAAPVDLDDGWAEAWANRIGKAGTDRKTRTEQAGNLLLDLAERLQP